MLKFFRQFNNLILYTLLAFIFIIIFLVSEHVFNSFFPRVNDFSAYTVEAALIVIIYEPLRKLIELYIKKILYNYYYVRQERIRSLDSALSANSSYKELADKVTDKLRKILNVQQVSLYFRGPEMFSLISSTGGDGLISKKIRTDLLYDIKMMGVRKVFDVDDLLAFQNGTEPEFKLDVLKYEGHRYIVPMLKKEGLTGIIALSKETSSRYELTGEDKKILWTSLQRVGHTLENARLYAQLKKSATEKELVLSIAKTFNSTIHLEKLLDMILDSIKTIVPYDAAGIFLVNEDNQEIESAVIRGYDEQVLEDIKMNVGQGLIGHVAKIAKPVIVKDVSFDEHYVAVRDDTQSEITIPISHGDRVIGVLNLESDTLGTYHEGFLDILVALASEAGIAIKNAQLNEAAIKSEELHKEMEIAGKIQQAILPHEFPHIENLDIAGKSIPCQAVGGDFYDILKLNDSQVGICIGDVSGKGVPGAIMMSVLYTSFRGKVFEYKTTAEMVSSLNNILCINTAEGRFATFFYCTLDFERLVMYYTNAGHNPPMILKKSGDWISLREGGVVLGFLPDQEYRQMTKLIDHGDIIVLYTDGVTEVFNDRDELFGDDRLKKIISEHAHLSAKEIQNHIIEHVRNFAPDTDQQDDITLVVIKVEQQTPWS
ncbi:SpoIIE family protein phosphatase [bacterium]|nr:MAG: SpoIIE family protein phosphatase [bacterium]